jgi:hypothetical protein
MVTSLSLAATMLAYEAAQGNRSEMLPVMLGLATTYYLYTKTRPRTVPLIMVAGVLLIGFAFLREYRDVDAAGRRPIETISMVSDPAQGLAETFTQDDDEMFDTMANLISMVPSRIPYQPLGIILDLVTRALPRAIFPDKPMEVNDQLIIALWPMHYLSSKASAASSIFGLFYLYGGPIGVGIAGLAIGVLLNQIWQWYLARSGNLNAILLYSFVPGFVVVLLRGTITDTLTRMFFTVMPLVVAEMYWHRKGSAA